MAEQVRVVVDAMGGDNAPAEPVKAAVEAVTERQDIKVILTGKQEVIDKELAKYSGYPKEQIEVVNASEVIETAEPPVFAIRKKKDSSIVVGLNMVKKQEADAFVSSGSTGAVLVGGQVLVCQQDKAFQLVRHIVADGNAQHRDHLLERVCR